MPHTIVVLDSQQPLPAVRLERGVHGPEVAEVVQNADVSRRPEVGRKILSRCTCNEEQDRSGDKSGAEHGGI